MTAAVERRDGARRAPGREGARALAAVLVLEAVISLPFLGARDYWAPDEGRYAQV